MDLNDVFQNSLMLFEGKFGKTAPFSSPSGEVKILKNSSRTFIMLGLEEFDKMEEYAGPLIHILAKEYAEKIWGSYEKICTSKEETASLIFSTINLFSGWGLFEGPIYEENGDVKVKVYNPFEKRNNPSKKTMFLLGFVKGILEKLREGEKFEVEEIDFKADGVKGIEFVGTKV